MKTKNILKAMAAAMLMPAMMLTTACSSDDDLANPTPENIIKKGYEVPVTVSVTRQGDADATGNRASFNESTKKLEFAEGDKLFVYGENTAAGEFAGTLDYVSDGKFSGTITTQNEYTGTTYELLTAGSAEADLLPNGYKTYEYLYIDNKGTPALLYDDFLAWENTKAFAESKAEAVEQFSLERGAYTSGTGFTLVPKNAVLNFTITGLAASTPVAVVFKFPDDGGIISKNVTTNGSGTAKFAISVFGGKDLIDCTLTVGGTAITLVSSSKTLVAGKIYNITRSAAPALNLTSPAVGQVIGSDGKNYAAAALPPGVTAVAMIAYLGSETGDATYTHGLALALADVSGTKAWCTQTSATCLTTQYSSATDAKGDMAGIANTDALYSHAHTHAAAKAARDYSVTRPVGTSAWFLPSAGQWDKMATAAGSYANLKTNAGLESSLYWSSSESSAYNAWQFYAVNGTWTSDPKGYGHHVRACLAF